MCGWREFDVDVAVAGLVGGGGSGEFGAGVVVVVVVVVAVGWRGHGRVGGRGDAELFEELGCQALFVAGVFGGVAAEVGGGGAGVRVGVEVDLEMGVHKIRVYEIDTQKTVISHKLCTHF